MQKGGGRGATTECLPCKPEDLGSSPGSVTFSLHSSLYKLRCIKMLNENFLIWSRSNDTEDNHDEDYSNDMIYEQVFLVYLGLYWMLILVDDILSVKVSSWHLENIYKKI
ncbi:hypothetical protein TSAR_002664 [Trichomalopsis sarcophagae]|uniref:Uncharacterized protein n=1 Tax=Trichomalopsis sarcophagae TaxID=543379 RepID=A0A232EL05_9HYME|nr:hypothetical protein TSAR_002664 [Trichomalopsis sarcophagae]